MELYLLIAFFILGAVIGSFLNVCALRYNTGMTFGGRSFCFSCGKKLHWHELVPIFSYLFLRGKCSQCKSHISFQYPLVELITGIIFASLFITMQSLSLTDPALFAIDFIYEAVIFSILIVISIYDLRHKIIPDGLVYAFALISLFYTLIFAFSPWNLVAGGILFLPFYLIWLISKGTWIGLGDAKLALGMGWFLGLIDGLGALFVGVWVGAIICIALFALKPILHSKFRLTMSSEIPFAPFLIIGTVLIFFFRWDVTGLHAFLSVLY